MFKVIKIKLCNTKMGPTYYDKGSKFQQIYINLKIFQFKIK